MSGFPDDAFEQFAREHNLDEILVPLPRDHVPPKLGDIKGSPPEPDEPWTPRLWDKRPDSVVHIAAPALHIFGMYIRQRCAWCGTIILEYDLNRIAVPVGQDPMPATWAPMVMVRVDGHMSAEVEAVEEDGNIKRPMDSCTFDPNHQIGVESV